MYVEIQLAYIFVVLSAHMCTYLHKIDYIKGVHYLLARGMSQFSNSIRRFKTVWKT